MSTSNPDSNAHTQRVYQQVATGGLPKASLALDGLSKQLHELGALCEIAMEDGHFLGEALPESLFPDVDLAGAVLNGARHLAAGLAVKADAVAHGCRAHQKLVGDVALRALDLVSRMRVLAADGELTIDRANELIEADGTFAPAPADRCAG